MSVVASAQGVVLNGPLLLAAPIALAAGALSFFSPCCLPLVPGYLSFVTGTLGADAVRAATPAQTGCHAPERLGSQHSHRARARTLTGAALFVLGFAVVFTSYGAAFGSLGTLLLAHQRTLTQVLGAVTVVLGLLFAGALNKVPWASRRLQLGVRPPTGLLGAPLLGVLFGIGWTPCIGPTLAAVLSLATTTAGAWRGSVLAFIYSLGLGLPFLVAAGSASRAMVIFAWPRRHAQAVMRAGGLMLVGVGALQVSGAWAAVIAHLQGAIGGTQLPL